MREGSGQLVLREIEDRDLDVLFEHWTDREAIRMAAFTSPDQNDRTAFERRWARQAASLHLLSSRGFVYR